ncbi:MAG TPA: GAF domain-containing protein [Patescibacteria group bacterium]|jgi:GAF domain-containing protein|nr:GAF domain-containing protein [Patescibacteria group bacterium]
MTYRKVFFDSLTKRIDEVLKTKKSRDDKLKTVCRLLKENVSHYNWVGFYLVDKKRQNELVLGPFEGEPTEHVRIAFGKGICGQAAKLEKTFLVQDVSKETNYLSCSANVKSEIVVPIFKNRRIAGELDIDSHALSPFTKEDKTFLKKIAEMTSELL